MNTRFNHIVCKSLDKLASRCNKPSVFVEGCKYYMHINKLVESTGEFAQGTFGRRKLNSIVSNELEHIYTSIAKSFRNATKEDYAESIKFYLDNMNNPDALERGEVNESYDDELGYMFKSLLNE